MNVKQDEEKSLRTYIRRFNDAKLEMTEVSLGLDTMVANWNSKLTTSLLTVPPEDVEDMMDHTEKYMNVEEALTLKYAGREQEKKSEKEDSRRKFDKAPWWEEKKRHRIPV